MSEPLDNLEIGKSGIYLFVDEDNNVQVRNGSDVFATLVKFEADFPQNPNHVTTKQYVGAALAGIIPNFTVRAASTAVIRSFAKGLAVGDTYDNVTFQHNDLFLVKNQVNHRTNGIYSINLSGPPTRISPDNLTYNYIYAVIEGDTNGGTYWQSTGSYSGPDDTPVYEVDLITFSSIAIWPQAPIAGSGFDGDLLGHWLTDSDNSYITIAKTLNLNGNSIEDYSSGTVQIGGNTAFGGNIGIPNTSALYFATIGDGNWRMGRDTGTFSMTMITSNALQVTVADSEGEGFAVGVHNGASILEFGSNGNVYVRNDIEAATYSTHDEYFTYNGSQFIVNLVDSWGGLQVLGRSGGEASIAIRPDNIEPGSPGSWAWATNGSDMTASGDFAIYNANADVQPFYISESSNCVGINQNNPQYTLDVVGTINSSVGGMLNFTIDDYTYAQAVSGEIYYIPAGDVVLGAMNVLVAAQGDDTIAAYSGCYNVNIDDYDIPTIVSLIVDNTGDMTGFESSFEFDAPITAITSFFGEDSSNGMTLTVLPNSIYMTNTIFSEPFFNVTNEGVVTTANNTLDDFSGNAYFSGQVAIGTGLSNVTSPLGFYANNTDKINLYSTGNANDTHGFAMKDSTLAFIVPGDGHYFGFYGRTDGIDTQVAYIDSVGNASFNGYLEVSSGAEMTSPVPESALYTGLVIGDNTSIAIGEFFGSFLETKNNETDEISGCGVTPGGLMINASFGSPSANLYYQDPDANVAFVQTANGFGAPLATMGAFYSGDTAGGLLFTVGPDELAVTDNVYINYYFNIDGNTGEVTTFNNTLDDGSGNMSTSEEGYMYANIFTGNSLQIVGALADGVYTCGGSGSITITNGVITAIS